ncbi:hypothetical protein [Yinghuangia seranimata]|uniref:hypothetical protein n=1 Tax=Yinghuangia seranimata TaxID=408067 RepID=UPI00248BA22F|nr:hypothetical protein [Yinghuangia seranimata]MDI2131075.1 hypothetical protein [Yinghuangia seranimata]
MAQHDATPTPKPEGSADGGAETTAAAAAGDRVGPLESGTLESGSALTDNPGTPSTSTARSRKRLWGITAAVALVVAAAAGTTVFAASNGSDGAGGSGTAAKPQAGSAPGGAPTAAPLDCPATPDAVPPLPAPDGLLLPKGAVAARFCVYPFPTPAGQAQPPARPADTLPNRVPTPTTLYLDADALVDVVNTLPDKPRGDGCTLELAAPRTLLLRYADGRTASVAYGSCSSVTVGDQKRYESYSVEGRFNQLLEAQRLAGPTVTTPPVCDPVRHTMGEGIPEVWPRKDSLAPMNQPVPYAPTGAVLCQYALGPGTGELHLTGTVDVTAKAAELRTRINDAYPDDMMGLGVGCPNLQPGNISVLTFGDTVGGQYEVIFRQGCTSMFANLHTSRGSGLMGATAPPEVLQALGLPAA